MKIKDIKGIKESNEKKAQEFKRNLTKGVWVDINDCRVSKVEIKNDLHEFYRYCDCDLIDIVYRTINGVKVCIVIDDEGLLKEPHTVSAFDINGAPCLVGNLLVFSQRTDDEGNMIGLTDSECAKVMQKVRMYVENNTRLVCVLTDLDY